MKKKKKSSGSAYSVNTTERILPDEGLHKARPVRFIELGTQDAGEFGEKFKVQVSYELVETSAVFNEDKGEQNFMVHRKYNKSLHKRADLGKDVRAILGKDFPEEGELEMDEILDRPCWVEVKHSDDGQYANVDKVIACKPSDLKNFPKSENECISLYLNEDFDEDVFDSLHDGLREKIEGTDEYKELFPDAKPKRKGKKEDEDEDEDDRPARKKGRQRDEEEEEEEEDEDERPARRKKTAPKKAAKRRK